MMRQWQHWLWLAALAGLATLGGHGREVAVEERAVRDVGRQLGERLGG